MVRKLAYIFYQHLLNRMHFEEGIIVPFLVLISEKMQDILTPTSGFFIVTYSLIFLLYFLDPSV